MEFLACFDKLFVKATSAGNRSYHSAAMRVEPFHFPTGELYDRFLHIVCDKHRVHTRRSCETTSVAWLRFNIADWNPFGDFSKRQDVARLDLRRCSTRNLIAYA